MRFHDVILRGGLLALIFAVLTAPVPAMAESGYLAAAQAYIAEHPEMASGIAMIPEHGTRISFVGIDGEEQSVMLMGRRWVLEQMGSSIVHYADPDNLGEILRDLYVRLTQAQKESLGMPSLDEFKGMDSAQTKTVIKRMARALVESDSDTGSANLNVPPVCADELGYENGSDCMASNERECSNFDWDENGLISRFSFPLERHLTCIKHQAMRGTCTAFQVNAALEIEVSKQFGDKVNLSEQHLYWYYKKAVERAGDQAPDGANSEDLLTATRDLGYEHQFESVWNYNPSWDRVVDSNGYYADSCVDYAGEFCSDTVHQGRVYSILDGGTGFGAPWTDNSSDSKSDNWAETVVADDGYVNRGVTELMDMDDREASLLTAAAYLDAGRPVMVTLHANQSFITNPAGHDGFMQVNLADRNASGHAVLAVGYLSCFEMASADPGSDKEAPLMSDISNCHSATGGGYFIVKNSWGPTYGDAGYVYIPYSWAENWFYHLVALEEGLD